jgi:HTH-type transcriptional regulator / antitoxin HigA
MADTPFEPDWFSKPGDTVLTLMERHELTVESLAAKLGCSNIRVRGLLAGTVMVDGDLASALSKHLGGTPKFWQLRQDKYEKAISRVAEAVPLESAAEWIKKFPHSEIARYGWVRRARSRDELVKGYLAYFGVNNPAEWDNRYADFLKVTAFRTSQAFKSKVGALSVWLRQGEIEAAQMQCADWNPKVLRERLAEMRVLTKAKNLKYFLPRMRRLCAEAGIAVVFVRAPSGCAASGATRFLSPKKAMVMLSFRHLTDDHFWFTFFHELGHLLLHDELTFIDGEGNLSNKVEREANEFSEGVLVPQNRREELLDLRPRREPIIKFAYSVGVSPGIIVGQLQHRKVIGQNQMNYLKRHFNWAAIESALA